MKTKFYCAKKDAHDIANHLSENHKVLFYCGQDEKGYYVEIPDKLKHAVLKTSDTKLSDTELTQQLEEFDRQELDLDNVDEMWSLAESAQRNNENGWFYESTDGDWENNVAAPETEPQGASL